MADNDETTENKILKAANSVFLLYGYHGTTIHKIADLAVFINLNISYLKLQ